MSQSYFIPRMEIIPEIVNVHNPLDHVCFVFIPGRRIFKFFNFTFCVDWEYAPHRSKVIPLCITYVTLIANRHFSAETMACTIQGMNRALQYIIRCTKKKKRGLQYVEKIVAQP